MSRPAKSKALCAGCRDNFYNGNNPVGVKECWLFKKAKVVRRWRLGWWVRPTERRAFNECYTLDCHHAPGQYAMLKELHPEAIDPVRLSDAAVPQQPAAFECWTCAGPNHAWCLDCPRGADENHPQRLNAQAVTSHRAAGHDVREVAR
jgi:hypothetical protein